MNNFIPISKFARYLQFFTILFFSTLLKAQAGQQIQKIDSLMKIAQTVGYKNPVKAIAMAKEAYNESSKIANGSKALKSLELVAFIYLGKQDFKKAHIIVAQGLRDALKYRIDSLTGDFWNLNGYIFHLENNYENAIVNYLITIQYYEKNKLLKRIGNVYLNIGICENRLSRFETANYYYFKSADEFIKLKDTSALSNTYNSIGLCFSALSNYKKALEYNRMALTLRLKMKDKNMVAQSYNNIGFTFKQYSQPDSAIFYLSKCLALREGEKDTSILVLTLQNLGSSLKMKGNFKKAGTYIQRSLRIAVNYGMKEEIARGNLDLAELYTAERRYKEALTLAKITENTATTLKLPELLKDVYTVEFNIYTKEGNYKNAILYINKSNKIKDSLFTVIKNKTIAELEIKYQTKNKEDRINALNLQNNLEKKIVRQQKLSIIALIIAAVLLLLLFIIVYNNLRVKNNANKRIQTLMQELHHRVKNNLQILSGLFLMQIENMSDENTKSALRENEARLNSMNLIHNKLYLDHSTTQIEMNDYLTKLLHHVKITFGGEKEKDINLRLEIEPVSIEADKAVAIGLIVNELATNAFKYAFAGKTGEIYLTLKQEGKSKLLLTLGDNGKGITAVHKKNGASFGLKLVNLMARQLNSTLVVKNETGTFYQMEINF